MDCSWVNTSCWEKTTKSGHNGTCFEAGFPLSLDLLIQQSPHPSCIERHTLLFLSFTDTSLVHHVPNLPVPNYFWNKSVIIEYYTPSSNLLHFLSGVRIKKVLIPMQEIKGLIMTCEILSKMTIVTILLAKRLAIQILPRHARCVVVFHR